MIRRFLACAVLCVLTASVSADQIAVKNASFEDPAQGPGGWTNTLPEWQGPAVVGNSFIEYIAGFAADGVNHLGMEAGTEVSQDLGVSLLPNTTYELTVGVGRRNASFTVEGNESRFGLYVGGDAEAGGILVADATYNAFPLSDSQFVDQTLSYTTGAVVPAGNLHISLRSTGAGRAHYDNVRLWAVPEPSSIAMTLVGLLGVVGRLRRR